MQQEILVMLYSSFANSQLNKNDEEENKNFSPEEKLEQACANGLIQTLLPEVFKPKHQYKVYLWKMDPGFSFLQLELGEAPLQIDKCFSINPHNFLITHCYN